MRGPRTTGAIAASRMHSCSTDRPGAPRTPSRPSKVIEGATVSDVPAIIRLHPDDIRALARALAQELRPARSSPPEVAAPGPGDQCDEKTKTTKPRGSMDHMSTT